MTSLHDVYLLLGFYFCYVAFKLALFSVTNQSFIDRGRKYSLVCGASNGAILSNKRVLWTQK